MNRSHPVAPAQQGTTELRADIQRASSGRTPHRSITKLCVPHPLKTGTACSRPHAPDKGDQQNKSFHHYYVVRNKRYTWASCPRKLNR